MALTSFSETKKWFKDNPIDISATLAEIKQRSHCKTQQEINELDTFAALGTGLFYKAAEAGMFDSKGGKGGAGDGVKGVDELRSEVKEIYSKYGVTNLSELEAKAKECQSNSDTANKRAEDSKKSYDEANKRVNGENGYAAQINTLNQSIQADGETLKRFGADLETLKKCEKPDKTKIQAKEQEISNLKAKIENEQKQVKELEDKIKAEKLDEKKATAEADAKDAESVKNENTEIQNALKNAQSIETEIKKKETEVQDKTSTSKNQNESRNEFDNAINGKDIEHPTEEMVAAADKWLSENKEEPSDPSQRAAYNICKTKAERIKENYSKNNNTDNNSTEKQAPYKDGKETSIWDIGFSKRKSA